LNNTSGRLLIHDNNALISLLGLDNMTSIGGELSIYGNAALSSLLGLEGLNHISGGCIIHDNNALISLTGLDNVTYIGGYFDIYSNDALTSLTGLEGLNDFGSGSIIIHDNNALTSLTGLDNITNIGFFSIYSNDVLTSLTGLDNLTSIAFYLSIYDNSSLSICNNQWLCNYLSNPNGSVLIYNNAPGCNSVIDLALSCGNAPCLPYGNYYFTSQTDIDNFQTAFPDCSTLNGYVIINGVGITNLTGLNNVASIADDLMIYGNSLNSLTGLDDLISIGGNLVIEHNGTLINVLGLEGLTSIGGSLSIWTNNALVNLTGLDNLISTGGYIEIADNGALTSLTGLDNVKANTISNLSIYSNLSLSTCDIKSICNYLAAPNGDVYIEGNAPGCNSPEEVQEACQAAIEEINASELTIIPNPAKDHITIEIPSTENIVSAELTDLQGRMVKKVGHCSGSKTVIDIYGVPKGLYLLIVITDKNIYSNKVIVN
jgi:hypothetical protein